jgi:hypothetical protein
MAHAGSSAHRALGRGADVVQSTGTARRLLLGAIVVLVVLLLFVLLRGLL